MSRRRNRRVWQQDGSESQKSKVVVVVVWHRCHQFGHRPTFGHRFFTTFACRSACCLLDSTNGKCSHLNHLQVFLVSRDNAVLVTLEPHLHFLV